jgi:hypothetical protein
LNDRRTLGKATLDLEVDLFDVVVAPGLVARLRGCEERDVAAVVADQEPAAVPGDLLILGDDDLAGGGRRRRRHLDQREVVLVGLAVAAAAFGAWAHRRTFSHRREPVK